MMFIDASAMVAILAREPGSEFLTEKLKTPALVFVSPMSLWEATIALAREGNFEDAERHVNGFVRRFRAHTMPITPEIGDLALETSRRYGRGRHKAGLNFGDCFAYACARSRNVPFLFKGEDFVHTDIEAA